MTFAFKLSRRLAQGFWVVGIAALAACAGEQPTDPISTTNHVNTVVINPSAATVAVNATVQLAAALRDAAGATVSGHQVTWTSDAETVATVSATGLVHGELAGTATIRAESDGQSASAIVTVTTDQGGGGSGSAEHAGYFVSPSGSRTADGSAAHPWDLASALAGANGRVQPGDTVWLRAGTYRGAFTSTVSGSSGKLVVFRQYPGEHAVIDGAGTARTGTVLKVSGSYVAFWGFEMTNTDADRTWSQTGNGGRPHALANYAPHTRFIALIVHDAGVGIYNDANQSDVEIVGCVFYNNGWQGPDRGHGHAIYIRSNTGPVTARDNILFNQFGYGVHVYTNPGEAKLNNVHIEGNIAFNNGTLATNSSSSNILLGGEDTADRDVVTGNMTWYPATLPSTNLKIGYGTLQNGAVTLTDNYSAGGAPVLSMGYWSSVTATGNSFMGTSSVVSISDPSLSSSKFSGQSTSSLPSATKVFVRKVPYETGRANIAVYNWGQDGAVSVNLDGVVPLGAQYEIRNVQDLNAAPVASGTFSGGSVSLPIRAVPPPAPIGWSSRAPATGTQFNAYVVTIRQ